MTTESYHETVPVTEDERAVYTAKAVKQDQTILKFLQSKGEDWPFTVETIEFYAVLPENTPHTSYIRAVSDLRRKGFIVATGLVVGQYGRKIHRYVVTPTGRIQNII